MEYRVSSEQSEMDFDVIHGFIANSYWAQGIYGPIRFARHSITILRRVHCTHISGLLLRDPSGPDGYLLLQSLSSLRLRNEPMPD